jgi:hypothetical protein
VTNVVDQHVEHATNKPVNACAKHLTPVELAVTVLEESELLDITVRLPVVLLNQILPLLLALLNLPLEIVNLEFSVLSALTRKKNVVERLVELATVKLEIANVSTDGPVVLVVEETEKPLRLLTEFAQLLLVLFLLLQQ